MEFFPPRCISSPPFNLFRNSSTTEILCIFSSLTLARYLVHMTLCPPFQLDPHSICHRRFISLDYRTPLCWVSHRSRMRLENSPFTLVFMFPTLKKNQFQLTLSLNPLITTRHHHTRVLCTWSQLQLKPTSHYQLPLVDNQNPNPYWRCLGVYDLN